MKRTKDIERLNDDILTDDEYDAYAEAKTDHDAFARDEVQQYLCQLIGRDILSSDGCYIYTIRENGVTYQGKHLGESLVGGLLGWVFKPEHLDDLLEELDATRGDVDHALEVLGLHPELT